MSRVAIVCPGRGCYTGLAVAGVLEFDEGFRLVQEMAIRQEESGGGGQLMNRIVDDEWCPDAARVAAVEQALEGAASQAFRSIELVGHGPYHTPLLEDVAARAQTQLAGLDFRKPRLPLVDGRGVRHSPWSTDVAALRDYTLMHQMTHPFDFSCALRFVLRECAPDELVLTGPGNTLGGVCGQVLVREGWRGMHSKCDFEVRQATAGAVVRSLGR